MKTCGYCNQSLSLELFYRDRSKSYGRASACITCFEARRPPTVITVFIADSQTCNKCGETKAASEFHKNMKRPKGLTEKCKTCRKAISRGYYERNKKSVIVNSNKYYQNNKAKIRPGRKAYQARMMKEDPLFVLSRRLRNRLYYALRKKFWKKDTKFFAYIGCSLEELKTHLESQFQTGMSWELCNFDIDHIVPLASATTPEGMYALCHYTNLQPLWPIDNRAKGAKLPS